MNMNRIAWDQLERIARSTLAGTALAASLWGTNAFADQQQVPASEKGPLQVAANETGGSDTGLDELVVTGIRYSLKESLASKRASTDVVEVVTAEDIGKLPDKNVADVLQRVPGVNTQSAASGEGGFDENNRVSIRGTSASLTQTTINGHSVATGDWFINDQYATAGRSVSYDLLPSEIVARTVVTKTQSADLIEGGVAGSIDLQTPKPLDFKETFTTSGLAGGVYSDLPSKTEPQFNRALFNWQNGIKWGLPGGMELLRGAGVLRGATDRKILGMRHRSGRHRCRPRRAANPGSCWNEAGSEISDSLIGQALVHPETRALRWSHRLPN